ncbi:flavodoxin domain-containing protein [Miniphocaeibacter massiliensis]|uniref:flavodoxin domain-containing protein n=1 Tax=Miniphocaeibacter massiliensis TaxID=2041841 RepID=UPI000C06D776|nr:flavodoxin domain-containing protein [Miniphocaeibacter massiliensis]
MNNQIIVIYKSKYGSTKKYAEHISEKLNCECINVSDIKKYDLENYKFVIYGGGIYAGGIYGVKKLKNYLINDLIIFTVGLSNPENTDYSDIISLNKKHIESDNIKFFHFRGNMDYNKLNFIDRILMAMLKKFIVDKKDESELTNDDKEMLETYGKKAEFINLETVNPLIEYIGKV